LEPISISNATVSFVMVMVGMTLAMPRKPAALVWIVTIVPIIAIFLIELWTGHLSSDLGIYLTILEVFIVVISTVLASWVSGALSEFESSVAQISLGKSQDEASRLGLGSIYREVRRARNHHRPLALISIGVEKSYDLAVDKMVQEIQLSMVKQYKLQGLSKMLCEQLEDCAVIVRDSDRFLAVLPETMPEELPFVLERLRQKAFEQVNLDLKVGVASLPHDGYTFEGLVDKATEAMENSNVPQSYVVLDQQSVERHIN
jgi:GGDEF domain-containing protein